MTDRNKKRLKTLKKMIKKAQQELKRSDMVPVVGFELHRSLINRNIDRLQKELEELQKKINIDIEKGDNHDE